MKKIIVSFIKEIVQIILGILIALYINNWNENRKDSKYIDHMVALIREDLKETHDDIKKKITQQKILIDTLQFYGQDETVTLFDIMMKVNGVQMPAIKINSWEAISRSKIELMDYENISDLAAIEEGKELLLSKIQILMNFLYPNIKETGADKKEFVMLVMQDIMVTQRDIQQEIEGVLLALQGPMPREAGK